MNARKVSILALAILCIVGAAVEAEDPVYFADANLKQAVKDALNIETDPTEAQMASLGPLHAKHRGIVDITGLEYATNLGLLRLGDNQIVDISALSGLTLLWHLNLDDNQISDISVLSGMTNLEYLTLNYNQISDISPLSGMTNLEILRLSANQISNISALSGITNLTQLRLDGNPISDISALSGLTNLTLLSLVENQISDISALSGMTNLTQLYLQRNLIISDISALSGMTNLTQLYLDRNQISDISALSGMTNLTQLYLEKNLISDISVLSGMTNLSDLWLHNNQISDISALSEMTYLTQLHLENNQISDISALSGLTNLTQLYLKNNQIVDISALSAMMNLTTLDLRANRLNFDSYDVYIPMIEAKNPGIVLLYDPYDPPVYFADANLKQYVKDSLNIETDPTQAQMASLHGIHAKNLGIADITGLEYATNLGILRVAGNQIVDTSPLSGLTLLWHLKLSDNQISDISPLSGMANLEILYLDGNQISDIPVLSGMANLETLWLGYNQISDISTLSGITNLTQLGLEGNQISDISALSGMTNLTLLRLAENQISDISALSGMTNLTQLQLEFNQISDISALSGLTNLTQLQLERNQISDISALSGLTNLTQLQLEGNQISDISPLSGMTNLENLWLHNNQISDISALSGLTNLAQLYLGRNQISDISALSAMMHLVTLDIRYNPLNWESHCTYIPIIQANNPGMNLTADPNPYNCDDNTPVGENVDVTPVDENNPTGATPLTLTFQTVTESGNTTLATSDSGPPPPTGLKLLGTYYEINTTAVVSGAIHISLEYDDTGLTLQQENNLKLRRYEETTDEWEDITYGIVDTDNNIIYGLTNHLSFFAVIYNVSPVIGSIDAPLAPVQVNTEITTIAFFSDPDTSDVHTAMWYWGDLDSTPGIVDEGTQIITGSHTYTSAGVYTITLSVMDGAGAASNAIFEYVVVFDPSAGFVTGGGWINSPPGAYTADPSLTGKANFGFVAKYKTGAEAPTGQTEFNFSTGDLNFHSSSYQWLVVNQAGTNAQFKGAGTINGAGDYKFMLWAGDDNPDTFRIKIWTEDEDGAETVAYDSGFDQEIGGGSIVIHTN